jgi:hypothetical protein
LTSRAVVDLKSAAMLMDRYYKRCKIALSFICPHKKAAAPTSNNPIERIVSLGEFLAGQKR